MLRITLQARAPIAVQFAPEVFSRLASPIAAKTGPGDGETIHLQASIRVTPGTVPGTVPTATPETSFFVGLAV